MTIKQLPKVDWGSLHEALAKAGNNPRTRQEAWEQWEPYGTCPVCGQRVMDNMTHNWQIGWCERCQAITYRVTVSQEPSVTISVASLDHRFLY